MTTIRFGITDSTDYSTKKPSDFPIMGDFYKLCEEEYMTYVKRKSTFTLRKCFKRYV